MSQKILNTMSLAIDEGIATLTLTREKSLNAMNDDFFSDILDVIADLSQHDGIKAMIVTGSGNGFSVGADLKNQPFEKDLDLGKALREKFEPMIFGLRSLPFPTIAAVNGYAAGAGMGLMLACDIVIAVRAANFVQAFINIALVPDAGISYFLPRIIGRAKTTEMMMLGEPVSAEDACNMGMIAKVVDEDLLMHEAMIIAKKLATKPTSALVQIRELLDQSHESTLQEQLNNEANAQKIAGKNPNFLEGVTAFLEKRKPKFK